MNLEITVLPKQTSYPLPGEFSDVVNLPSHEIIFKDDTREKFVQYISNNYVIH